METRTTGYDGCRVHLRGGGFGKRFHGTSKQIRLHLFRTVPSFGNFSLHKHTEGIELSTKYEIDDPDTNRYMVEDLETIKNVAEALSLKYPFGSAAWQAINAVYLDCEIRIANELMKKYEL